MLHREMLIAGHFVGGPCDQAVGKTVVRSPWDGSVVGTAAEGGWNDLNAAMGAAQDAFQVWRRSTRNERQALLRKIAASVRDRAEELALLLTDEVGKPITWSRGEVARMALTFDYAADVLSSWGVESLPVDMDPRGKGYRCEVERFPLGPILCIVPYNWPFNLAAHKLAPALATGNTVVVKPSPQAPLSTLTLVRLIHEAGFPPGVVNAVPCEPSIAQRGVTDPRIAMLSFTGSPAVGWKLKALIPEKKCTLELGGNASTIVCEDADLDWATQRIVTGAYGYAGQVCISTQHVLAHRSIYDEVRARLIAGTRNCPTGDPRLEGTLCGPLISEDAAARVEEWVREAVAGGATVLAGGSRKGSLMQPTLIEGVPDSARLANEEVFGPVLTLEPYDDLDGAISRVNRSQYGIHAAIFARNEVYAEQAFRELEVGGVVVNDFTNLRFDNMPYGGVKRSGFGREGLRYAMDEMTEPRVRMQRPT